MYYKLSNIASVEELERAFEAKLKYPDVYLKKTLINGFDEEILPIITNNSLNELQYGIWGILPDNFIDSWQTFQSTYNTLNLSVNDVNTSSLFSMQRRCIISVTGYFYSYFFEGELYPFYTYPKSKQAFALAGVYNITLDGYITFSLLLTEINDQAAKCHNINTMMPIIIAPDNHKTWLSDDYIYILNNTLKDFKALNFQSHPIAGEFYKNNITYKSFLDPVDYDSLAIPFLH